MIRMDAVHEHAKDMQGQRKAIRRLGEGGARCILVGGSAHGAQKLGRVVAGHAHLAAILLVLDVHME